MSGETKFKPPVEEIRAELPAPTLWRVLIRPLQPKEESEVGIVFTEKVQRDQEFVNQVGQVVAVGPKAFEGEKFDDSRFAVGDWVLYPTYGSQRIELADGRTFQLMNDDHILAGVADPEMYRKKLV